MRRATNSRAHRQHRNSSNARERKHGVPATEAGEAVRQRAANRETILTAVEHIAAPGQCVGLWIKEAQDDLDVQTRHRTGYFTDIGALAEAALSYSGHAAGVYITANPIRRNALDTKTREWAWNKLSAYAGSPDNKLIDERRRLLIDVDPQGTPKDASATDAEKEAAKKKGEQVRTWLHEQGWPEPLVIDSGNGVQLVYRIKIPVESALVKEVLYALATRFDDDTAVIDKSVSSAKTLMRLPGTWNCKGKNRPERPHRRARILSAPKRLKLVSQELLEAIAAEAVQVQAQSSPSPGPATDIDLQQAKKYLDKMEPAARTGSDGSSKAIKAARAIVVGFDLAWDSEAAWQLMQHYNARCNPSWNLANQVECQDLRRKLKEAHEYAEIQGGPRGYLRRVGQRLYQPLDGPEFPLEIPDWDWMAKDTPSGVLDNPPIPYAYGLRALACWWYEEYDILVPDVLVKLAHWGANAPKHWRKSYRQALAAAKMKIRSLKRPKACSKACVLRGSKLRHRHYRLKSALGGLFDDFYDTDSGKLVFEGVKWTEHFANGDVYRGYWPVLVFGTAKPVGLTPSQAKLLAIITRELTRLAKRPTGKFNAEGMPVYGKPPSDRPDRAEIIENAMVANSAYSHDKLVCPLLDKNQRYVGFNGNFRQHRARGYLPTTWLQRMGYEVPQYDDARRMLLDMTVLAEKFNLIVVGRHHASSRWYTVSQMLDLLETRHGRRQLRQIMLRVYAPEDFLTLWRYRFSKWLGFSWIPGADCPFPTERNEPGRIANGSDLRAWMKEHGVTQSQLAQRAKIRRQTVSENLHRSSCSARFLDKINAVIHTWS